ncbi:molybdenum cofactor biosynthesis protein B [Notoacmeibacter sp. MSK16QG-6]|uniref:molybdenum cofactor biosynthesis protein B n=1 Tax=Notoacmeibacter sp. MSK16QG-6 TaxID=2957982 RepID=UPI00209F5352|nr:molybdenum cofactor biosynthesis protein B [Notoacmeibacter sp. MSK16QG-6]MCP1198261.1 molybdenum cofactor biosynthesis protein B [Notoacmeibacter sp. MSK16QG-6]
MSHNRIDENRAFIAVGFGVITVSDTRTLEEDRSGDVLASRIAGAGHELRVRDIVRDEIGAIQTLVREWSRRDDIDAIILTGGTGFTGRDVTPDAIEPLYDKAMDGFSAIFHRISFEKIGTSTIQSRASAGLINQTFVFSIPGSTGACKDAWDGIFQPQFDYRHMPCNFVEIMPRLDEHLKRGGGAKSL